MAFDPVYAPEDGGQNKPPAAGALSPDREPPGKAGTTVRWTGAGSDPDGDSVLYQFWLSGPATGNTWKAMTNWSEEGVWIWTTSPADVGNNIVEVRVRDGWHAGAYKWDDLLSAEYLIEVDLGRTPRLIGIKPDKQSPQPRGSRITWTAVAEDPDGDTVLYQFWLKGPSTEDVWVAVTPWTTNNVWIWNSSESDTGIYTVEVRIRDGYHAGPEGSDDFERAGYVIRIFVE